MDPISSFFGNPYAFKKAIDSLTDTSGVNHFYGVFTKALLASIDFYQKKEAPGHYNPQIKAFKALLYTPAIRQEINDFFRTVIQDIDEFQAFIQADRGISLLSDLLCKIINRHETIIDIELASIISKKSLEIFREQIFNELSEKQGNALLLESGFSTNNRLDELLAASNKRNKLLQKILKNQEQVYDRNAGTLSEGNGIFITNREIENNAFYERLLPILKDSLEVTKKHLKEKCPANGLEELARFLKYAKSENVETSLLAEVDMLFGDCYSQLREYKNAANYYLSAVDKMPDNINYLYNSANAHLYLGQSNKVGDTAKQILTFDPDSNKGLALSLLYGEHSKLSIEELVTSIPKRHLKSVEVLYALSRVYQNASDYSNEIKYLKKALKINSESTDVKLQLAKSIADKYMKGYNIVSNTQLSTEGREDLEYVRELYIQLWGSYKNTSLAINRVDYLLNISSINFRLGDRKKALKQINKAIKIAPDVTSLKYHKILFLYDAQGFDKALKVADKINLAEFPDIYVLTAEILFNVGKEEKCIEYLETFFDRCTDASQSYPNMIAARRLYTTVLIKTNRISEAETEIKKLKADDFDEIGCLLLEAKVIQQREGESVMIERLDEILVLVNENTHIPHLVDLADSYYYAYQWQKALQVYKLFITESYPINIISNQIHCFLNTNRVEEALELCNHVLSSRKETEDLKRLKLEALIRTKRYEDALEVIRVLVSTCPEKRTYRFKLVEINVQLEKYERAEEILTSLEEKGFSHEDYERTINYWVKSKCYKKVIAWACKYQMTYNDFQSYKLYMQVILNFGKYFQEYFNIPEKSGFGTVVSVLIDENQKVDYFLEEEKGRDYSGRNIITPDDPLFEKLNGKKLESQIEWVGGVFKDKTAEIVAIQSKWNYIREEILDAFQGRLSDKGFMEVFSGTPEEQVQLIHSQVQESTQYYEQVEEGYKQRVVSISTVSALLKKSQLKIFRYFRANEKLGIQCALFWENAEEQKKHLISAGGIRLAADITGLVSLFELGYVEQLTKLTGKIKISETTRQEVEIIVQELKTFSGNSFTLYKKDGQSFIQETTAEQKVEELKYYESFLEWIDTYCELMPIMVEDDLKEAEKYCSISTVDTLRVCRHNDCVLYSDDGILRRAAAKDYNISGVWSEVILRFLLHEKALKPSGYQKLIVSLIQNNYDFVGFDFSILIYAAQISDKCFDVVCRRLEGTKSEVRLAGSSAAIFLYYNWNSNEEEGRKRVLLAKVCLSLTSGRNKELMLKGLYGNFITAGVFSDINPRFLPTLEEWAEIQGINL